MMSKIIKEKDTLSSGLATTHEQVSDANMEGEIKAVIVMLTETI